jgi:chaperonin cofactor prefoldin
MAVTSLEGIAEKLQLARSQKFEEILSVSGSLSEVKQQTGVTNVSDDITTSLIFKKLDRIKLDNSQIEKAIDVKFNELKPDIPVPVKDLVLKSLYDDQVNVNQSLNNDISNLNNTIDSLNTQIQTLQSSLDTQISNRIDLEQSNDILINQSQTLSVTIDSLATQIRNALQKSVEESVLRSNLQAQNSGYKSQIETLIKQVDSLNSMVEGLQSQLGAVQQQQIIEQNTATLAANSSGFIINDVAVVVFEARPPKTNGPQVMAKFNAKGGSQWMWGSDVVITNNDVNTISVKITIPQFPGGARFFRSSVTDLKIEPKQNKRISFILDEQAVRNFDSKDRKDFWNIWGINSGYTDSKSYSGGLVNISVSRSNNSIKDRSFETAFDKKHPNSY